ncbi:MAG: UDP-N-acetylmuramoyl-L-alanine--D-glutamate ligase [Acidobacteria bacterium]|nr:UDP-N-acetylmuramoyl-L-alanine--D-glutamate ligase [Acidobacteriota bacterium]MCB9396571.1 UDP-N-acetylmuramoyl-L-alanine--D-glutamate ligase [Acidobacteriota bacterium]
MTHALILGMGLSGRAAAQLASQLGSHFDTYDDRTLAEEQMAWLEWPGFRQHRRPGTELNGIDEIVVSPGVPPHHPLLIHAQKLGLPVRSEVEFAFEHAKAPCIGITGSNGKSTTTALMAHLINASGSRAIACGNFGLPFSEAVLQTPPDWYVLELSSFQLEHIRHFRARAACLLNLTPDHMDHHGTMAAYLAAKLRIFENQTQDDSGFFPAEFADQVPGAGQKVVMPLPVETQGQLHVLPELSLDLAEWHLLGAHNHQNLAYATAMGQSIGLSVSDMQNALANFRSLHHRLEPVGEWQGRTWLNDSKATNPEATLVALSAMVKPFVLILGGSDKGSSFQILRDANPLLRAIVAYGVTAPKIAADLAPYPVEIVEQFDAACLRAHQLAGPGETVLLSPACASFDQFANYMARGDRFAALVRERGAS